MGQVRLTMQPPLRLLFIMDPYETLNLDTETSLLLMQELLGRGLAVDWLDVDGLVLRDGELLGQIRQVSSIRPLVRSQPVFKRLDEYDVVLPRMDPPVDSRYLQLTQLLDFLPPRIVQINPAYALRNFNEKLLPLQWPEYCPPTLVSNDVSELTGFLENHADIVLKPLNECSGRGIVRVTANAAGSHRQNLESALARHEGRIPLLLAQKFLPGVSDGDKRVFLLEGEALAAVNRRPQHGSWLANIHQGAHCEATRLSERERDIITRIGPFLREHNILLAGADFIDGYLTELNITSPSALRQINAIDEQHYERAIVDRMIQKVHAARAAEHALAS